MPATTGDWIVLGVSLLAIALSSLSLWKYWRDHYSAHIDQPKPRKERNDHP
jgi:hypothetical protein